MSAADHELVLAPESIEAASRWLEAQRESHPVPMGIVGHQLGEANLTIARLRAELSALKARRCDGCAHGEAFDEDEAGWGDCIIAFNRADDTPMGFGAVSVRASHSCAAWTEKP